MPSPYALGKRSYGFCDICGFRYLLAELTSQSVAGRKRSDRVCPKCWSPDHPQNWQGRYPIQDPQALRDPRPDNGQEASREIPPGPPFPPPKFPPNT